MLKYNFIFWFYWLSSEDNLLADLLSRPDGEADFLREAYTEGFWTSSVIPQRISAVGPIPIRHLPEVRGVLRADAIERASMKVKPAEQEADEQSTGLGADPAPPLPLHPNSQADVGMGSMKAAAAAPPQGYARPRHGHRRATRKHLVPTLIASIFLACVSDCEAMPVSHLQGTISYTRASVYSGLPSALEGAMEAVMDNRLSTSSWRTIEAGLKHWRHVCTDHGWSPVIPTDDP